MTALLTSREAALYLHLSERTLERWRVQVSALALSVCPIALSAIASKTLMPTSQLASSDQLRTREREMETKAPPATTLPAVKPSPADLAKRINEKYSEIVASLRTTFIRAVEIGEPLLSHNYRS